VVHAPLSELARKGNSALPEKLKNAQGAPVVVFCHHGIRSAQVAAWLLELGWTSVYNLSGGIDAYARSIDPSIGFY
jgi:rhodanese-related sulfurtransferase